MYLLYKKVNENSQTCADLSDLIILTNKIHSTSPFTFFLIHTILQVSTYTSVKKLINCQQVYKKKILIKHLRSFVLSPAFLNMKGSPRSDIFINQTKLTSFYRGTPALVIHKTKIDRRVYGNPPKSKYLTKLIFVTI